MVFRCQDGDVEAHAVVVGRIVRLPPRPSGVAPVKVDVRPVSAAAVRAVVQALYSSCDASPSDGALAAALAACPPLARLLRPAPRSGVEWVASLIDPSVVELARLTVPEPAAAQSPYLSPAVPPGGVADATGAALADVEPLDLGPAAGSAECKGGEAGDTEAKRELDAASGSSSCHRHRRQAAIAPPGSGARTHSDCTGARGEHDLARLRLGMPVAPDVSLRLADGMCVSVHRAFLAARVPYFRAVLCSRFADAQSHVLPLPDLPPEGVLSILFWAYTNADQHLSHPSVAVSVLLAADWLQARKACTPCSVAHVP